MFKKNKKKGVYRGKKNDKENKKGKTLQKSSKPLDKSLFKPNNDY